MAKTTKKEYGEPRKPIVFKVEDLYRFAESIKAGGRVEIEIEDLEGISIRKKRVLGIVMEKYPYHCIVRYHSHGKLLHKSVKYVDMMLNERKWALEMA